MPTSYTYTSGPAKVVCATLQLSDGRYCGNFIAIVSNPDGRREIHERMCPYWDLTLADALVRARAMAEAMYPPTSEASPEKQRTEPLDYPDGGA